MPDDAVAALVYVPPVVLAGYASGALCVFPHVMECETIEAHGGPVTSLLRHGALPSSFLSRSSDGDVCQWASFAAKREFV